MKNIKLLYSPRAWALPFHSSKKRWMVLVVHRRAGKTTAAINFIQLSALKNKNCRYAYIAPTYKQAKNVAWAILKDYSRDIPGIEQRESELTVRYPSGSTITLFGADSPDSLRGMGLAGVVFDEYSQQPSNIFSEVVRPMLADHNGYAIWIGTPKGKNEFYRLYQKALNNPDWLILKLTVEDTEVLDINELSDARKVMSDEEFLQEWYCSFEASIKGAYYAKEIAQARNENRITFVPYDKTLKVHTVSDIGVGSAWATGFYQIVSNELHMIDYWQGKESEAMPDFVKILRDKPYIYGKHFAPHDIRAKELSTGKTRLETAQMLGINFEIVTQMSVDDGINAGRLIFSKLWINEKTCEKWLDAISQYRQDYNEKSEMFSEKPIHDWTSHGSDVHRYASIVEHQMTNEETKEYISDVPYETPGIGSSITFQNVYNPMSTISVGLSKNRIKWLQKQKHDRLKDQASSYETNTPWQKPGL